MDPTLAAREAQIEADKCGYQLVVVDDPIGEAEDSEGTAMFMPTLALPIFIRQLRHGGKILQVIEPRWSADDRRKDLEDGLVALFRTDPERIAARL